MPRAGLSYRGKAPSSYNLSVSLRSTAPLVGEPLAKPFTLRGLPKPLPLGEVSPKVTERASPAGKSRCAAMGRLFVRAMLSLCQSCLSAALPSQSRRKLLASSPKGGAIGMSVRLPFVQPLSLASLDSSPSRGASGEEEKFSAMPRPPLGRGGGTASAVTERLSSSPKGRAFA